ncbi:MAG: short-chain dehydrogenase/reductase, partial [Acidimicrobiaceae bacterium]|nr:short-chain dehydrogenase/reductase [Acidimicrobiaceae bacterium]
MSERADDLGLAGRVAVLTGAANGLGATTALWLAERGVLLALLDVDEAANDELAAQIADAGGEALAVSCDVSEQAAVAHAAVAVRRRFDRCDILINNATTMSWRPLEDVSIGEWDRVVATNLRGYFLCLQTFGRVMLGQ